MIALEHFPVNQPVSLWGLPISRPCTLGALLDAAEQLVDQGVLLRIWGCPDTMTFNLGRPFLPRKRRLKKKLRRRDMTQKFPGTNIWFVLPGRAPAT